MNLFISNSSNTGLTNISFTNATTEHAQYARLIFIMDIIIIVLSLISILLHSIGSYALIRIYKKEKKTAQKLYIINLSLLEGLRGILCTLIVVIPLLYPTNPPKFIQIAQHHVAIISEIPIGVLYYIAMIYLTIDRLLAIILGIKYHITLIALVRNVKVLLLVTCTFGVMLAITFTVLHDANEYYYSPYHFYIYLSFDIFFIVLAFITYITIFRKYINSLAVKEKKKLLARNREKRNKTAFSVFNICRPYSSFYVSILLITNFLLFIVMPDLVNVILIVINRQPSNVTQHALLTLNMLSDIVDACIYIFLQWNVRQMVCRMFHLQSTTCCCFCREEAKDDATDVTLVIVPPQSSERYETSL